jgi:hypothetical protein
MKIGLGHLGLAPAVFWAMTLPEFFAALEGHLEKNGAGKGRDAPMLEEADELFTMFDDEGRPLNG